jgi:hypothetical protein
MKFKSRYRIMNYFAASDAPKLCGPALYYQFINTTAPKKLSVFIARVAPNAAPLYCTPNKKLFQS